MNTDETITKTGADQLARTLHAAGCRFAFGIPGGEVLALIEGLSAAGIRFVLTKHENAAGFMAEGGWHADGAPGILVATLGPGVANAVNVVANAMQDRVPLIFLTGCVDASEAESYTHQIFDHQALLRPIVKASFRATEKTAGLVARKAVEIAQSGQPGPVHIDVPISVAQNMSGENDTSIAPSPKFATPTSCQDAAFENAAMALLDARRPLILAGVDAVNHAAGPVLTAFSQRRGIPVVTTYKGKGLVDEKRPHVVGGAGLSPKADAIILPLVRSADCVLLAGYDPIEMRIGWRNPFSPDASVIEITPVLRSHGMHAATHVLTGDIAAVLGSLDAAVRTKASAPDPLWTQQAADTRTRLADAFEPPADKAFTPSHVFHALRAIMPDDTVITADSGAHRILLSQIWTCTQPRSFLQSTALCTMACAVPIAAGYRLVDGRRPVVAFVGDAGLEMGLGELATIRDLGLALIVVVLVDESLALIEMKQRASQRPNLGVDFSGSDFAAIATALGGSGVSVSSVEDLRHEARLALDRQGFTVIAAHIGRKAYDGLF